MLPPASTTTDHRRAFVKAVAEANPDSPSLHRTEARNASAARRTPPPRLLGTYDDGTWVALVFEDVAGRRPVPRRTSSRRVLDAVEELGRALTPAPFDAPTAAQSLAHAFPGVAAAHRLRGHRGRGPRPVDRGAPAQLAELFAPWAEFATGDTLAHADLRADNVLLTKDGGVVFVDWPARAPCAPPRGSTCC